MKVSTSCHTALITVLTKVANLQLAIVGIYTKMCYNKFGKYAAEVRKPRRNDHEKKTNSFVDCMCHASGLTAEQEALADVIGDGIFNASDAAVVLIFSAAVGAGNTDAKITDFVH